MKVLYKNNDSYVNLGEYPFIDPKSAIQEVNKDLTPLCPQKLIISEAAYIGHTKAGIIVKKMEEVDI